MNCGGIFATIVWIFVWQGRSQLTVTTNDLALLLEEIFEQRLNYSNPESVAFMSNRNRALNYTKTIQNDVAKFLISSFLTYCPNNPLCYDKGEFYQNYSVMFYRNFSSVCQECSCASDCINNCCVSKYIPIKSNTSVSFEHDRAVDSKEGTSVQLSCTSTHIGAVYNSTMKKRIEISIPKYLLVVNCPKGYSRNFVWQRCKKFLPDTQLRNEEIHTPVTSVKTNQSYQNKYCAQCFDENQNYLHFWKKVFVTDNSEELHGVKENLFLSAYENRLMVFFKPPSFLEQTLACHQPDVTRCNVTGLWRQYDERLLWACEKMKQTLLFFHSRFNFRFKNLYCAMCNTFSPEYTLPISAEDKLLEADFSFGNYFRQTLGLFPSLLGFTAVPKISNYKVDSICDSEFFYSPVLRICLPIICDPEYIQQGPKCQRRVSNDLDRRFFITALICSKEQNKPVNLEKFIKFLTKELKFIFKNFRLIKIRFPPSVFTKKHMHCHPFIIDTTTDKLANEAFMTNFLLLFFQNVSLNYNNVSSHLVIKSTNFDDYFLSSFETRTSILLQDKNRYSFFYSTVRVSKLKYCPKIYLPEGYHVNYSDFEVCIIEYDVCLNSHLVKFEQENQVIAICLEDYRRMVENYIRKSSDEGSPETYFSIVCLSVSSFGCILTLITFCASQNALNTAKKLLIALSLSLFLANTFYTTSRCFIYYYPVCMIFGLLSHFCWLLVFSLMTALCFDMFLLLFGVLKFETSISFTAYLMSTLTLAMSMVTTHIRLSHQFSEGSSLGYSKTTCFIENRTLKVFTFVLPVAIMVLLNTLVFILTIYCIKRNTTISNSRDKQNFKIYLKLSTVTGMAWFFGFIYELVDVPFFSHIHSFFSGCIGMFIFIAFGNQRDTKINDTKVVSKSLSTHCEFYQKRSEIYKNQRQDSGMC